MSELLHRIKVFVYRMGGSGPDYLLLKPSQGIEALWGPIQGSLGFGEKLDAAIRRKVMDDTGLTPPAELVDLELPGRWTLGDEEIIEWSFGYHSINEPDPSRLEQHWEDYRWLDFSEAYPTLAFENDRAAIMRLHAYLNAA